MATTVTTVYMCLKFNRVFFVISLNSSLILYFRVLCFLNVKFKSTFLNAINAKIYS